MVYHEGLVPVSVQRAVSAAVYRTVESFALDIQSGDDITPALQHQAPVGVVLARLCHELGMGVPAMLTEPADD